MVTDRPLPNDWILLHTCIARMGELHAFYRSFRGYAERDLEAAVRAGRAALRGCRPGRADHPPETIGAPITARHRLDMVHNALGERRPGPSDHSVLLFRDVEIEWNAIKEYLQAGAAKCWPAGGIQKRRQREGLKEAKGAKKTRSRGPLPGTIDRYGKADKKLFPAIEKMIQEGYTVESAALALARNNRVQGVGTPESRATRLAKRFRKYQNSLQQNLTRSD
jgi:hypothetical protein